MFSKFLSFLNRVGLLIALLSLVGCARKGDKWLNRNYHAMTTYYNVIYHGNLALENGRQQIEEDYIDDFWEPLPIEPLFYDKEEVVYGEMVNLDSISAAYHGTPEKKVESDVHSRDEKEEQEDPEARLRRRIDEIREARAKRLHRDNPTDREAKKDRKPEKRPVPEQEIEQEKRNEEKEEAFPERTPDFERRDNPLQNNQGIRENPMRDSKSNISPTQPNDFSGERGAIENRQNELQQPGEDFAGMPTPSLRDSNGGTQAIGGNQQRAGQSMQGATQNMGERRGSYQEETRGMDSGGFAPGGGQAGFSGMGGGVSGGDFSAGMGGGSSIGFSPNIGQQGPRMGSSYADDPSPATLFEADLLSFEKNESFEVAESKAVKAVEKHSLLYKGVERNREIKDAFLLLGKSRYYQQRLFPALEAFNYILNRFENSAYLIPADIWKEKTYLRLGGNEERVIQRLTYLINNSAFVEDEAVKDTIEGFPLSRENLVEAASTLGQAYYNEGAYKEVLKVLDLALDNTKSKELRGRYLYIKGQLLEQMQEEPKADSIFGYMVDLNRKIPRKYWIRAYMKKMSREDIPEEERVKTLKHLLKDWELKPYRDLLNYQMAEIHRESDAMDSALKYYNRSLHYEPQDHKLKYHIYNTIGNFYYDQKEFEEAGYYYDSTMVNLPAVSRTYRELRKKRLDLIDVVHFEEVSQKNDSILYLAEMAPEERREYLMNYIDSIKNQAVEKIQNLKKADLKRMNSPAEMELSEQPSSFERSSFYFYDPVQVERGRQVFKQIWGDRDLQDNWRTDPVKRRKEKKEKEETKQGWTREDLLTQIENDPKYQVQTYLKDLPESQHELDSLADERNFAYYRLGLIYAEKLEEYELATRRFERLLEVESDEELILPAEYQLYKIYKLLGNKPESEHYKEAVLKEYPDSRYAKIMANPQAYQKDNRNPEKVYSSLYRAYEAGAYEEVQERLKRAVVDFGDDDIIAKMELLKAFVEGRLKGVEAYEKELRHVALTYPQREEGQKAQELIENSIPHIKGKTFVRAPWAKQKLIYRYSASDLVAAEKQEEKLKQFLKDENFNWLHTSIDVYAADEIFVVVHGLRSQVGVQEFEEFMNKRLGDESEPDSFAISSDNYEKVLIYKSLDTYLLWKANQTR